AQQCDLVFRLRGVDGEAVRRLIGHERGVRAPAVCAEDPGDEGRGVAARGGGERLVAVDVLVAVAERVRFAREEQLERVLEKGERAAGEFGEQLELGAAPEEPQQRPRAGRDLLVALHQRAGGADVAQPHRVVAEPAIELVAHGMRFTSVIQYARSVTCSFASIRLLSAGSASTFAPRTL